MAPALDPSGALKRSLRCAAPTGWTLGEHMARQGEERLGIALAEGPGAAHGGGELRRQRGSGERGIDGEAARGAGGGHIRRQLLVEEGAEIREPVRRQRHAGRHGVPAALHEDSGFRCGPHGASDVDAGQRAGGARALPFRLVPGDGDGGALEAILEA